MGLLSVEELDFPRARNWLEESLQQAPTELVTLSYIAPVYASCARHRGSRYQRRAGWDLLQRGAR